VNLPVNLSSTIPQSNVKIRKTLSSQEDFMFNWLSTQFHSLRRGLRPAPHIAAVAVHNAMRWSDPALTGHTRVYQQSPWVYIAVNRIAEAAALVPLRVFRLEGERRVEVERHPLERLLDRPNPHLSRFELFEQTIGIIGML
jgi:phage portal protein BeeE